MSLSITSKCFLDTSRDSATSLGSLFQHLEHNPETKKKNHDAKAPKHKPQMNALVLSSLVQFTLKEMLAAIHTFVYTYINYIGLAVFPVTSFLLFSTAKGHFCLPEYPQHMPATTSTLADVR